MALTVNEWLDSYREAWESRDADAAAALFTEDTSYRETPYTEPFLGRDGVHAYWTRVTATQEDVKFVTGTPVEEGSRAAVEWWATMRNGGADITLAGEFLLTFDEEGLCQTLREYWHFGEGRLTPGVGWGL